VASAAACVLTLAACGSQYPGATVAEQVRSWTNSSPDPKFSEAVSEIDRDLRGASEAQQLGNEALLRTECDVLVTDSLSANQNLPAPDAQLTSLLTSAYTSAVDAGQDCFCAGGGRPCPKGQTTTSVLVERFYEERSETHRWLIEAQARVDMFLLDARQQ